MRKYLLAFRAVHMLLLVGMIFCVLTDRGVLEASGEALVLWIWSVCAIAVVLWMQYANLRGRILVGNFVAVCMLFIQWQPYDMRIMVVFAVLGCYVLQIFLEKYPIIMDILILLFVAVLLVCMIQKLDVNHMTVVLCNSYIVLGVSESVQRRWKKVRKGSDKEYILWILPFVGIYMFCMGLTPVREDAYDWQWAKDIYHNIYERVVIWSQSWDKNRGDDFDTALSGFSEEGYLVGNVLENDKELMTIQGTQGVVTNLYMVGKVYDTFDGRRWTQTVCEDSLPEMDTVELLYAVTRYDREAYKDYIYRAGLRVWFKHFRTECLFAPLKVAGIEDCEYTMEGSNLIFTETKGYNNRYGLSYWQMNLEHPCVYDMLEAELSEDEEAWNAVLERWGYDTNIYTLEALSEYRKSVYAGYGTAVELSEEMNDWVVHVKGQEMSEIEMLQSMESALSSLEYTKHPGALPESVDNATEFLDYFIGESKQGYCSYFATAFVLLARAEGLPARYVEGFCVPLTGNKNMKVTANMAHAWPEVYIEGKGWIPFEPTPGYSDIRYTSWETGLEQSGDTPMVDEENVEEAGTLQNTEAPEVRLADIRENRCFGNRMTKLLVVVSILLVVSEQLFFRYHLKHMNVKKKFLYEVHRNQWLLERLHLKRTEEETLEEFATRSREKLQEELSDMINPGWILLYEEYLYGEIVIQDQMIQGVKEERKVLLALLRDRRRLFYYYILVRMIFLR